MFIDSYTEQFKENSTFDFYLSFAPTNKTFKPLVPVTFSVHFTRKTLSFSLPLIVLNGQCVEGFVGSWIKM